ncbi:aminotransferase class V-fold PLP-dependent enzyme [Anaerococcus tetradius]|uniref:aminotransferase class V-fold PLP-dependent enzyme n=1 Tax=Anaerococcus tetradius TaxID=33036 RepID=UPI0023F366A7|nr:aminotransferase class V-fold PLP-dependent enzyme [Anaerococcus tetradius]
MIYLDNAATSLIKPDLVRDRLMENFNKIGNPSRGFNKISLETSRMVLETRIKLAKFFNIKDPRRISFTNNATEALNIAISSFIDGESHVITSVMEHNSVLRPLYLKEAKGTTISYIDIKKDKRIRAILDLDSLEDLLKENTRAIVISHVSNLSGNITDLRRISTFAKAHGLILIVDSAQSAGLLDIDVEKYGIDVLCFTGHKSLFAIQGIGGIYVREGLNPRPIKVGGSGINSFDKSHPTKMPEALEAGTINAYGILSLNAGLDFINGLGLKKIRDKEKELLSYFTKRLKDLPQIISYGDDDLEKRAGIVSISSKKLSSDIISKLLAEKYDISTRAGAHCAPLAHKALGTEKDGIVRFSFSYFNEKEEIDQTIAALKEILGD